MHGSNEPPEPRWKSSYSPARQRLIEWMQDLEFGQIEELEIQNGDPVLDPMPRAIRSINFTKVRQAQKPRGGVDFVLKAKIVWLFDELDRRPSAHVRELKIEDGLPVLIRLEDCVGE